MDSEALKEFAPAASIISGFTVALATIWLVGVPDNTKITASILLIIAFLYFYFSSNFAKKSELRLLKAEIEKLQKK